MPFNTERPPQLEPLLPLIEAYTKTFIHHQDCYPIQLKDGSYATIPKPLHTNELIAHLKGTMTLGAYALDENSIARWLCLDADEDEQWHDLCSLSDKLLSESIMTYLEPSRRGGHLWFFTSPLSGTIIRQFARRLLKKYDLKTMEIYPKQDILQTGTGSLVRLPLGTHRKTNRRYHFILPNGAPLAPTITQQLEMLSHPVHIPNSFIEQVLSEIPSAPPLEKKIFAKVSQSHGETLSERIKNSISVLDFVSRYVELDHTGRGFCPFHDDQHKSFGVHQEGNFWHCYAGCGGGSLIDFWMKWREKYGQDSSFTTTITDLAKLLF